MMIPNANIDIKLEEKKENLKEKARLSGCEMTDGQILFMLAELEREQALGLYLRERGLEIVNERTRESLTEDFEKLRFDPDNKDISPGELLDSLFKDENGEFIWDLFTPDSGRKHCFAVYNGKGDRIDVSDISKILPSCGNSDISSGSNPFDKDGWNMTLQSKIYKENPEIAKYLAAAAKKN